MSLKQELCLDCEITFRLERDGGPSEGFWPKQFHGYRYRPCIVIGDPNQKSAKLISKEIEIILDDGSKSSYISDKFIDELYLGVGFKSGPENPDRGAPFLATIVPIIGEAPETESLQPDVTFTIREGANIVGQGQILKRYMAAKG